MCVLQTQSESLLNYFRKARVNRKVLKNHFKHLLLTGLVHVLFWTCKTISVKKCIIRLS